MLDVSDYEVTRLSYLGQDISDSLEKEALGYTRQDIFANSITHNLAGNTA